MTDQIAGEGFDINRNIRKILINHVDLISHFDFLAMISLFGMGKF